MSMKVLELHHVGLGVTNAVADQMRDFYRDVLSLEQDQGRWHIPGIHGYFINVPGGSQIHILGSDGPSPYAKGPGKDPVQNHLAVAVESVADAEAVLKQQKLDYFTLENVASPDLKQLFVRDPAGNMVEIHQKNARRAGVVKGGESAPGPDAAG